MLVTTTLYKPLNWMTAPTAVEEAGGVQRSQQWGQFGDVSV